MTTKFLVTPEYTTFLTALKGRISSARLHAARAVNRDLILLYWDIGRSIVEKQEKSGWGESVVEMLAKDLQKAFPGVQGFSANNLWLMRQFYKAYSSPGFLGGAVPAPLGAEGSPKHFLNLEQPVQETRMLKLRGGWKSLEQVVQEVFAAVPWGQHVELLKKVKEPAARLYYLRAAAQLGWSRNVLLNQIKAGAYERAVTEKKTHNFQAVLPEYLAEQAEETLKSSYCLEFLGIQREAKERELEDRLIERLKDFILELGYGFCFIGRQHRLALGQKEYFIDLLFYHRFLKALVAFELKVGPFEPEYAGKMDFYLNLLNDKERGEGDNPSIGVILCAEKDEVEVEYALRTKRNPIGVAAYQLRSKLPGELKGKLPTQKQLSDAVRAALPERNGK